MHQKIRLALYSFLFFVGISISLHAAIPLEINIEGQLTDSSGVTPVANGTYPFTFNLYSVASGGSSIYSEGTSSLPVTNGVFNYLLGINTLGTSTALTLSFGTTYWLGIAVNGDAEMSPRQPIVSVGNTYRALNSDSAYSAGTAAYLYSASNILYGYVPNGRLNWDVALLDNSGPNDWSCTQVFNGAVGVNMSNELHSWIEIGWDYSDVDSLESGHLMAMGKSNSLYRTIIGYDVSNDVGYVSAGESGIQWKPLVLSKGGGFVGICTIPTDMLTLRSGGNLNLLGGNIILASGYTVDGVDVSQENATWLGSNTTQNLTAATYYDVVTSVNYVYGGVTVTWSAPFTQRPSVSTDIQLDSASFSPTTYYTVQWTAFTETSSVFSGVFRVIKNVNGTISEASTNDVYVMIHAVGN